MSKPWLKRTFEIVGTLALVALVVIVYRRTNWSKGFTPDGVMTLIAGVIAFIAVIVQIRSSSKQVQDQIKAQRDADREERKRQKRAIAAGLLAEVRDFHSCHIQLFGAQDEDEERIKFLDTTFPVYEGNTARIGELAPETCEVVVHFYGLAIEHLASFRRYREIETEKVLHRRESVYEDERRARQTMYFKREVESRLSDLKDAAEKAILALSETLSTSD
jgi:hypothetical protein